jgi:23S rRNA-/tRNA-specific pseudouridylate synthase
MIRAVLRLRQSVVTCTVRRDCLSGPSPRRLLRLWLEPHHSMASKRSLSRMSKNQQQEEQEQGPPPNVVLTWELSKERPGHATISLQPVPEVAAAEPEVPASTEPTIEGTAAATVPTAATAVPVPTAAAGGQEQVIPASVLQYERQHRKAQHEKKAGLVVTQDQLHVVFEDHHIVVVNKPPGVLTVPGVRSNSSLLDLVHAMYGTSSSSSSTTTAENEKEPDTETAPPPSTTISTIAPDSMIVHRLDMDTSGLVLFSRTLEITRILHAAFANRKVEKEYHALLIGHLPDSIQTATLDLPLQRDHEHPPFMRVSTPRSEHEAAATLRDLHAHGWKKLTKKRPKPSQTELRVVERGWFKYQKLKTSTGGGGADVNNESDLVVAEAVMTAEPSSGPQEQEPEPEQLLPYTRVRLIPITGRTHQLRVHCAALGYPIVGDPTYSLYGEASPVGGLQDYSVVVAAAARSSNSSDDNENENANANDNETLSSSVLLSSRPSLDIQKAWTVAHPPNVEPMCLHAAMLQIHHPVTGELLTWEVPPAF